MIYCRMEIYISIYSISSEEITLEKNVLLYLKKLAREAIQFLSSRVSEKCYSVRCFLWFLIRMLGNTITILASFGDF